MRFLLGVAESGVFPATLVLLANWFPRNERARANAYWTLCQPLAVAGAAPVTAALLGLWGWRTALIVEGALPFIWLPMWWYFVRDHPREAKWISKEELDYLETTLAREATQLEPTKKESWWKAFGRPAVFIMVPIYFLQNCAAYGSNTFLSEALKGPGKSFSALQTGLLYAVPYVAAVCMILNSRHSDKLRNGVFMWHLYAVSGSCLIASAIASRYSFWLSFFFLCFAIMGPFAAWRLLGHPAETLPKASIGAVMGLVNAVGNIGGWAGNYAFGWLKQETGGTAVPSVCSACACWWLRLSVACCPSHYARASRCPSPAAGHEWVRQNKQLASQRMKLADTGIAWVRPESVALLTPTLSWT
jgi:MFS family permease